jgi:hypothetical protein
MNRLCPGTRESCPPVQYGPPQLKDWAVALETAAASLVLRHIRADLHDSCLVRAEPCAEHGPDCAHVTYGMLRDHFAWAEVDPLALAERLVATMLPQEL